MKINKFFMFLLIGILCLINGASAELVDNFERADSSTIGTAYNGNVWNEVIANGNWEISSNTLKGSNTATGNTNAGIDLNNVATRVDFKVKWDHACSGDPSSYTSLTTSTTEFTNTAITINWCKGSQVNYYAGRWYALSTPFVYQADIWYDISFRNCDYTSYDCDLYIDDILYQTALNFRTNVEIDAVMFTSSALVSKNMVVANLTTNSDSFDNNPLVEYNEAYWILDNVLTDSTSNGNTIINNLATSTSNGVINEDYEFDGSNSYMSIPTSTDIGENNVFTLNFWTYQTGGAVGDVLFDTRAVSGSYIYIDDTDGTGVRFIVGDSGNIVASNEVGTTYKMISLVKEGTGTNEVKVYIDGVLDAQGTDTTTLPLNMGAVLGARYNFANLYNGHFDEVGIWKRALSSTEITELHNLENGLQYPYTISEGTTPTINNDMEDFYNSENITIKLDIVSTVFNTETSNDDILDDFDLDFQDTYAYPDRSNPYVSIVSTDGGTPNRNRYGFWNISLENLDFNISEIKNITLDLKVASGNYVGGETNKINF